MDICIAANVHSKAQLPAFASPGQWLPALLSALRASGQQQHHAHTVPNTPDYCSPKQEALIRTALDTFYKAMSRILEQRRQLQARLDGALRQVQAPGGLTTTTMEAEEAADMADETMEELSANLVRGHGIH